MGSLVLIPVVGTRWYASGLTTEGTSNIVVRLLVRMSTAALTICAFVIRSELILVKAFMSSSIERERISVDWCL